MNKKCTAMLIVLKLKYSLNFEDEEDKERGVKIILCTLYIVIIWIKICHRRKKINKKKMRFEILILNLIII